MNKSAMGKVILGAMLMGGLAMTAQASEEEIDGAGVYNSICVACHMVGAAGAPIVGKDDVWQEIVAKGTDEVYRNAIEGVGAMPPKGGKLSLSDEEVMAAVDHMIESSQ